MKTGTSIAQGAAWSLSSRFASQAIQFVASIALARVIAPEAFGIVGMAATVSALLALFVDAGLGVALVQKRELAPEQAESAFATTLAIGALGCALLALTAPLVTRLYGPAILTHVIRAAAAGVLLSAIGIVPRALLVRQMRLGTLAVVDLGTAIVTQSLALGLALAGADVWALVISTVASAGVTSASLVLASGFRPRLIVPWKGVRPLLGVGLPLLAFNFVNYWSRNVDNVLIGAWIGERELGLYLRAYALMMLPLTEFVAVLSSAVLPALSRLQDDASAVKTAYLRAIGVVALITTPVMAGLSLLADPLVIALYGSGWAGVGPILRVLAIVGALQAIVSPVGWLYTSQGRTDLMFRWGTFSTVVTVGALAYGASLGSGVHVARAYLAANAVLFVPAYVYAGRLVGLRVRELAPRLLSTVGATAAMACCVVAVGLALPRSTPSVARLAIQSATGLLSYVIACRSLRNGAALDAASLIVELRPSWRRWVQPLASLVAPPRPAGRARVTTDDV